MPLYTRQINAILRDYDITQLSNRHALDLRKQEVYLSVPRIAEIDDSIAANSVNWLISSFSGGTEPLESLTASNSDLWQQKQELLVQAGFPEDYLELKYDCPDCKDTGFIGSSKCHCFTRKVIQQLYADSNLKNTITEENFNTFDYSFYSDDPSKGIGGVSPLENIRKAVDKATKFVDNFDSKSESLLLYGSTGVGKTFLCNCIAKALMDSYHTVVYQTEYEFFDTLEAHKFNSRDEEDFSDEKFACMEDCDLLIIDDLGAELKNSFIVSELFRILNERILRKKSTIISTNLQLSELKNEYDERIFSRIVDNYTLIRIFGEDIRFKKSISGGHTNGQATGNT